MSTLTPEQKEIIKKLRAVLGYNAASGLIDMLSDTSELAALKAALKNNPGKEIADYLNKGRTQIYEFAKEIKVTPAVGYSEDYPQFDVSVVVYSDKGGTPGAELRKQEIRNKLGILFRSETLHEVTKKSVILRDISFEEGGDAPDTPKPPPAKVEISNDAPINVKVTNRAPTFPPIGR